MKLYNFIINKTLTKKKLLKLIPEIIKECKMPPNTPACYPEGQEPTKLTYEQEVENHYIEKFNKYVDETSDRIKRLIKTSQV